MNGKSFHLVIVSTLLLTAASCRSGEESIAASHPAGCQHAQQLASAERDSTAIPMPCTAGTVPVAE